MNSSKVVLSFFGDAAVTDAPASATRTRTQLRDGRVHPPSPTQRRARAQDCLVERRRAHAAATVKLDNMNLGSCIFFVP